MNIRAVVFALVVALISCAALAQGPKGPVIAPGGGGSFTKAAGSECTEGTDDEKGTTPLCVAQAIPAQAVTSLSCGPGFTCSSGPGVATIEANPSAAPFDPTAGYHCHDELMTNSLATSTPFGQCDLTPSSTSFILPATGAAAVPGMLTLTTTTSATAAITYLSRASALLFGSVSFSFWARVRVPTLSDATETATFQAGFVDGTASVDGCFFRYSHGLSAGNWEAVCKSNSVETVVDTGVPVAAGTFYALKITNSASTNLTQFWLDGASVANITTNIPSATGREFGFGATLLKSAGTTARTVDLDYIGMSFTR
jgi:hypothetical protein